MPAWVYEKLSTLGTAPCATIARPVARCHQKSFGGIGVSSGRSAISARAIATQTWSSVSARRRILGRLGESPVCICCAIGRWVIGYSFLAIYFCPPIRILTLPAPVGGEGGGEARLDAAVEQHA